MFKNSPRRCAEMPSQCSRCDDKCSKRDGMKDRHDYRPAVPQGKHSANNCWSFTKRADQPHNGRFFEETDDGYCTYSCKKWPYRNCWVHIECKNPAAGWYLVLLSRWGMMSSVGPGGEETARIHSLTNLSDICGETIQSKIQQALNCPFHRLIWFWSGPEKNFLVAKFNNIFKLCPCTYMPEMWRFLCCKRWKKWKKWLQGKNKKTLFQETIKLLQSIYSCKRMLLF